MSKPDFDDLIRNVEKVTERDEYRKRALGLSLEVLERAERSASVSVRSVVRVDEGYEVLLTLDEALDFDGEYSIVRWDDEFQN